MMPSQRPTFMTTLSLFAGMLLATSPAVAAGGPEATAKAYAKEFGFKPRAVTAGPAQRRVQRLFVPVTPESWARFNETFAAKNGFLSIRYNNSNQHTAMALKPGDVYLWAKNGGSAGYFAHQGGGPIITASLPKAALDHLGKWLDNPQSGKTWSPQHCMRWLPNAEVGPDKVLFHELGITRANGGIGQASKLIHAANNKVRVIGMCVANTAEFDNMTDANLLGPAPQAGVDEAIR